jgi:hypothetical protein
MVVQVDDGLRKSRDEGERPYTQRAGQLNLACRHCHRQAVGG